MYVDLHEASFCAVASVLSVEAEKNGYRFEFWSTTPIFSILRRNGRENAPSWLRLASKRYQPPQDIQLDIPTELQS